MSVNPDWGNDHSYACLKTVLKWEIQHLLQRLAEAGEEAFLFTVCVNDGGTTEMGSPRGQVFLSMSDLQNVKSQFQSYCQGFSNIGDKMEIYRDLSSGQLSFGPKSSIDSDHRRKRRKKTYLQQQKVRRLESDQQSNIRQELSSTSDENSDGNTVGFDPSLEQDRFESIAETDSSAKLSLPMLSMKSRRKRTPMKVVANEISGEDDNNESSVFEKFYHTKDEYFDNQSENFETTGSHNDEFYVKKSQSMDQISEFQPENLELTSHSEDFSINNLQCNQDISNKRIDSDIFKENSSTSKRSFQQPVSENYELSVLLKKTKETLSRKPRNSPRKSIKMNSTASFETDVKSTLDAEKSMPVFPNFASGSSVYANSVGVANSVGGAEDMSLPMTTLGEDGFMRIAIGKSEVGGTDSLVSNEDSLLLGQLSRSAENSPKMEKQAADSSSLQTPSRKKGFKPVPHDENPAETALLDASKLGVGRYKCPMCGQTTRDRHDLKRHLRTHTKEKPYKCSLCGKKFTRKWDLENHYSRHNKTERDEANAKMGKQFNKAIEAANAEVLTYEKLVSKLLSEKNITVRGSNDTDSQSAEEDKILREHNEHLKSSKSIIENVNLAGVKCCRALSVDKELQGQETVAKGLHSNQCKTDSDSLSSETLLDHLVVKFMNDTSASVATDTATSVNDEQGNEYDMNSELENRNGSRIDLDNIETKTEPMDMDLFPKLEKEENVS